MFTAKGDLDMTCLKNNFKRKDFTKIFKTIFSGQNIQPNEGSQRVYSSSYRTYWFFSSSGTRGNAGTIAS